MLQSTVAALRGAVAGSLQLAAVVDSVLGGGAGAQEGEGLSEELLAKVRGGKELGGGAGAEGEEGFPEEQLARDGEC